MTTRETPANWSSEAITDMWSERPLRRLRHRRYWSFWWRTNAKLAAASVLFWILFAWMYVKFVTR